MKVIYHHLGLGDHIICNSLVRHLTGQYTDSCLICKNKNVKNVKFMYRDNPRINIVGVEDDKEAEDFIKTISNISSVSVYRLGFAVGGKKENCLWDENFYKNAQALSLLELRDNFYYRREYNIEYQTYKKVLDQHYCLINQEPYAFVHRASSSGIDGIDHSIIAKGIRIIYTDPAIDFFDYGLIIQNASEIHCVNSSFKHLIERIPTSGKLYYHKTKHLLPYSEMTEKKNWIHI